MNNKVNNRIVASNLALMTSKGEEGMLYAIQQESMGGNARFHRQNPCVGINFEYNLYNGKIVEFTNDPKPVSGTFRVVMEISALKLKQSAGPIVVRKYPKIVQLVIDNRSSPEARNVLNLSVKLYNKEGEELVVVR